MDQDLAKFQTGIWNLPETLESHLEQRFRPAQTSIWSDTEHRVCCTDQGTRIENFGNSGQNRTRLKSLVVEVPKSIFVIIFFIMAQQHERDIIRLIAIILDGPTSSNTWSQNMWQSL